MTDHAHELRRYARKIGHPAGDVPAVMRGGKNALLKAARLRGFCVSACTFACTRITPHTDIQHRRLAQQGNPSEQTKGHRQRCDRH